MIKKIALAILFCVAVLIAYYFAFKHAQQTDQRTNSSILPSEDREKIVVNPVAHTIQVTTAKGTTKQFLPNRPSSVEVRKNGDVVITAPQMGVEHGLYWGCGFASGSLRFVGGVDLAYYKRLDLGLFVSDETAHLTKVRTGLSLSYTTWHDIRFTIGIDNQQSLNLLITERI